MKPFNPDKKHVNPARSLRALKRFNKINTKYELAANGTNMTFEGYLQSKKRRKMDKRKTRTVHTLKETKDCDKSSTEEQKTEKVS